MTVDASPKLKSGCFTSVVVAAAAVAGGPDGPLATYTIMTVDASPKLSWLHNRMPVLLQDDDAVAAWLGGSSSSKQGQQQHGDSLDEHKQQQQQLGEGSSQEEDFEAAAAAAAAAGGGKASAFKLVNQVGIVHPRGWTYRDTACVLL
jgi:hypothetical protein